ncbi:MAG: hypothetical protein R3353_06330, partial [Salegentibacter mishustinae]|nr:hypothetical protein [Salegentibacter mishustinae]
MKQFYPTNFTFTFRLLPLYRNTSLFLLIFLLNFTLGFGQDCTITSTASDLTDESPIPLDLNFEGAINRDLVADDFDITNGGIGSFQREVPEYLKGGQDKELNNFLVSGSIGAIAGNPGSYIENAVISISQLNESEVLFLTYGAGVKNLNLVTENIGSTAINGNNLESPLDIEASLPGNNQRFYLVDKDQQQVNVYNSDVSAKLTDFKVPNYDSSNDVGPTGIVTDDDGNIYVAVAFTPDGSFDVEYDKIAVYTPGNYNNPTIFPPDNSGVELDRPYRIAVDNTGKVYVADSGGSTEYGRVLVFDENYNHIHTIEGSQDNIGAPGSIVIDDYGYVYIVDYQQDITFTGIFQNPLELLLNYSTIRDSNYAVNVYDSNSNFEYVTEFNQGLNLPIDLEVDFCGNILINNLELTGPAPLFSVNINFNFQLKTFTRHDNFTAEVTPDEAGEVVVALNSENDFFPCDPQPECSFS